MQRLKIQVHQNRMSNVEHWATEPTSAWSFDFKSVWAALIIHTNSKFLQNFELNQWPELVCHVANDNTDYSVAARKRHWYNSKFWWNFEFVCVIWAAHTDLKSKPHTLEPTARFLAGERNRRGSRNSKILAFLFLWYRCIFLFCSMITKFIKHKKLIYIYFSYGFYQIIITSEICKFEINLVYTQLIFHYNILYIKLFVTFEKYVFLCTDIITFPK